MVSPFNKKASTPIAPIEPTSLDELFNMLKVGSDGAASAQSDREQLSLRELQAINRFNGVCINGEVSEVKGSIAKCLQEGNSSLFPLSKSALEKHCNGGIDACASPLYYAAGKGHVVICDLLVEAFPFLVNATNKYGSTALHWAAFNGHANVVKFLLREGADCNATSNNGNRALCGACEGGHDKCVEALLEAGASQHYADSGGISPIMRACVAGRPKVVSALLASSAFRSCSDGPLRKSTMQWAIQMSDSDTRTQESVRACVSLVTAAFKAGQY